MAPQVDYSIYLVTDSTEPILGQRDLVAVVEEALKGACRKYNVPLVINDRVDVALAVGCEGVHLGQDDMQVQSARKLLGPDKIIGATVSNIDEVRIAVEQGADYLGIGTLYATATKKNTKDIIGVNGVRKILSYLGNHEDAKFKNVKTVCIGGVNLSNIQLIKHKLFAPGPADVHGSRKTIDGVAIVSAIMSHTVNPQEAAAALKEAWNAMPAFGRPVEYQPTRHPSLNEEFIALRTSTQHCMCNVHEASPLSHNMTNLVVQNFAASLALAIGASPIMSNNGAEAGDLAALGGALVINMGTSTPQTLVNQRQAIQAYNKQGRPVVLDPVGAGATAARKEALQYLMDSGYFDVIKGNEKEILAVAIASGCIPSKQGSKQRGVDSGASTLGKAEKAYYVSYLARRERNIVLMTGETDIVSDGVRTYAISNGHEYLGLVTGSGCTLGTTISAYLAANPEDKLHAVVAAILHFELAAEDAAKREDVQGPGTFIPAFIDELWKRRKGAVEGRNDWNERARVSRFDGIADLGVLKEF
ncbi:HK-domain-containing protein [Westerdykella ornata]|uniref:HK-domain-containing protein n=1 Tax=Westerdykella ornata TaxID=318751 RepID=A0A6A6JPZ6_WESOR|nr:HK-domain-containing protein [Westerdykella ornata]KAF2277978.1 HK-domain-containing protein [Westerdykella ornata]